MAEEMRMSSPEENKKIVTHWFDAIMDNRGAEAMALHADSCRFFIAGDMPYGGWMDKKGFMGQTSVLKLAGPITMRIGHVVADGDQVWVEAQSDAALRNGNQYNNNYVFMFTVRDGSIVEYKEFVDTLHVYRVLADEPLVNGPAKPREKFLTTVTRTLGGPGVTG
jgi:uncharacterized protein